MSRSEVLTVDNLIGGVSQQPESLRDRTKSDTIEDAYLSPVDGFGMRPPTEHIKSLISGVGVDTFCHVINRDATERYLVVARTGSLQVFGLDGEEFQVHKPGGGAPVLTYLSGATPSADYRAVTVADYTMFLNRNTAVAMDAAVSDDYKAVTGGDFEYLYVWCRQTAYETLYEFDVELKGLVGIPGDDIFRASHTTPASTTGIEDTDTIINELFNPGVGTAQKWLDVNGGLGPYLGSVIGFTTASRSSICRVKMDYAKFTDILGIRAGDGVGDTALKAAWRSVQKVSDLPPRATDGQLLEVKGSADSGEDGYWVRFKGTEGSTLFAVEDGTWEESLAVSITYKLDEDTMPHQLIRQQDDGAGTITGTPYAIYFEWGPATWIDRQVGDELTNPLPSFVSANGTSRYIKDIFFHKNRLGFLSDDNVILSAAGDYFNFWRTTVRDLLDSDRIDTSAAHTRVAILENAVSHQGRLLGFSDKTQFIVDSGEVMSPATAEVTTISEYDNQVSARPVSVGRTAFFAYANGDYAGIRELYQLGDSLQYDAVDISKEIPQYMAGAVKHMAASTLTNDLIVLTDNEAGTAYIYKFLWNGAEKVQSAWSRWNFGVTVEIVHCEFVENDLYLIMQRGSEGLFLEKMRIQDGGADPNTDYRIHLDRRVSDLSSGFFMVYDGATDTTRINLPYNTVAGDDYWVVGRATATAPGGESYLIVAVGTTYIEVRGNVAAVAVWVGREFVTTLIPTRPFIFTDHRGTGPQIHAGRQTLRHLSVTFDRALSFQVVIHTAGRDDVSQTWTPLDLGALGSPVLGAEGSYEGRVRFPIMGEVREVQVEFRSTGPYPFHLGGAEWEVQLWSRSFSRRR